MQEWNRSDMNIIIITKFHKLYQMKKVPQATAFNFLEAATCYAVFSRSSELKNVSSQHCKWTQASMGYGDILLLWKISKIMWLEMQADA